MISQIAFDKGELITVMVGELFPLTSLLSNFHLSSIQITKRETHFSPGNLVYHYFSCLFMNCNTNFNIFCAGGTGHEHNDSSSLRLGKLPKAGGRGKCCLNVQGNFETHYSFHVTICLYQCKFIKDNRFMLYWNRAGVSAISLIWRDNILGTKLCHLPYWKHCGSISISD